jgi:ATP-dependent RNA helicase DeaD
LTQPTTPELAKTFEELSLSEITLESLRNAGYHKPTPIQAGLIPLALQGIDVVGQARTGTGKTAAFVIPILERLKSRREASGPQALVLTPTRELAVQVRDELAKLAHGRKVHSVAVYGGKPIRGQIEKLERGAQVIVGTPGRILDHMSRGTLRWDDLWCAVLDEADRMLDIGFRPDIEKILRRCPRDRQTLLLSATVPPPILRLARRYMQDPQMLDFSPKNLAVDTIEQHYFTVDSDKKFELLVRLLIREKPRQAIIFCRTKRGTERLYQRLSKLTKRVECIHGDMPQTSRDRVMLMLREGRLRLLVATDVVGRGIDVTAISHIINYDIPQFCDDYVHRVGRTGRMGGEGVAFTFVAPEEGSELTRIEQRINVLLKRDEIRGLEAAVAQPQEALADEEDSDGDGPPPSPFAPRRPRYRRGL